MNHKIRRTISLLLCAVMAFMMLPVLPASASVFTEIAEQWQIPEKTQITAEGPQHLQGFAVDLENNHMYWSFTTTLIKTDLEGVKIDEVSFDGAHLGDLAYYDGYIYGSYLINSSSNNWDRWEGFYLRKYDTELNLVAEYELEEFKTWANAFWAGDKVANPYDIAGLDGVTIGEDPNGNIKIMIAAGIGRVDNLAPYQVIVQYSLDGEYETYYAMETGALPYGCQNLTYNWDTGNYWLGCYGAEYDGQTDKRLFEVDIRKGYEDRVVNGWAYSTNVGLAYAGNNMFYTSKNYVNTDSHTGTATLSVADEAAGMVAYKPSKDYVIESSLYYTMDEGDIATTIPVTGYKLTDEGALKLDAQVSGATLTGGPDGAENTALAFTADSQVAVPQTNCKILDSALDDALTMSFWLKIDGSADYKSSRFMHIAGLTDSDGRYVMTLEASWSCFILHIAGLNGTNTAEAWAEGAAIQADKWYHIATTYNVAEKTVSLYVDGERAATYTGGLDALPEIAGLTIGKEPVENAENIGSYEHATGNFLGAVADFSVYGSVLTDAQIGSLKAGEALQEQPLVHYLMDTTHLSGEDTPSGGESGGGEEPPVPESNLPLDYSNMDSVDVTEADGKYVFTSNSKVTIQEEYLPEFVAALKEAGEGTISAWVKVETEIANWSKFTHIMGLMDSNGYPVLALERNWGYTSASTNVNSGSYSNNTKLSTTEWVHLLVTAKNDSVELYLNGVKQSAAGPAVENLFDNVASFQIGGYANRDASSNFTAMDGGVENVYVLAEYADTELVGKLYNKQDVSAHKVVLCYEVPAAFAVTNEGSLKAEAVLSEGLTAESVVEGPKAGMAALHFDGDDFIEIDSAAMEALNAAVTDSMTISAWVKMNPGAGSSSFEYIAGVTDANGRYIAALETAWNYFTFHGSATDGSNVNEVCDWATTCKDSWTLLTGVYDGENGVLNLYINSTLVATYTSDNPELPEIMPEVGFVSVGKQPVSQAENVGSYAHQSDDFIGDLSEFRLYGSALAAEEVAKIYAGTATTETPLIHLLVPAVSAKVAVAAEEPETAAPAAEAQSNETSAESVSRVLDKSGNFNNALIAGEFAACADSKGNGNGAIDLSSGSSMVLSAEEAERLVGPLADTSSATISAWVRVDNAADSDNKYLHILSLQDSDGYAVLSLERRWGYVVASTYDPAKDADYVYSGDSYDKNSMLPVGEWCHVVVTANTTSIDVYLNGVKQANSATLPSDIFADVASFQIGGTAILAPQENTSTAFDGAIDDVHVFPCYADQKLVDKLYQKPGKADIELDIPKVTPSRNWLWTADWREQIFREDGAPNNAVQSIVLDAARNESEAAQIVLRANGDFTIEEVTISDLVSGENTIASSSAESHFVGFAEVKKNTPGLNNPVRSTPAWFPEKLLNVSSIEVKPYSTQPIWIRYTIPKNAAAGTYTGTVTVKTDMGDPFVVPVTLTVYDATLPDPENGTFNLELWGQLVKCFEDVGGDLDVIGKAYGIEAYSDDWWDLMETYAEFMRVNRLNSLFINVADLLADAPGTAVNADGTVTYDWSLLDRFVELFIAKGGIKQISAEHLCAQTVVDGAKGFKVEVISGTGTDTQSTYMEYDYGGKEYLDRYLPLLHAHLEQKGWLDIWHQHIGDEPTIGHMPRHYLAIAEQVHNLCPGVTVGDAIGGDNIEEFDGSMDCWVPTTSAHEDNKSFFAQKIQEGKELWLYTAMHPSGAFMNRFIDTQLYKSELLGWLCYKYGATGYLHWGLMEWYVWEDFDPNDNTVGSQNVNYPGDSWCIYPDAENMGIISSIRLEAIREAAEDYELFKLFEQKNAEGAKNLVDSAVRNATNYTTGVSNIAANRKSLLSGAAGSYVAPSIFISKTDEPVKVDGVMNDVLWSMEAVETYAMNRSSGSAGLVGNASFLWSDENLYIAVEYAGAANDLIVYLDGNLTQGAYDEYTVKYVVDMESGTMTAEGNAVAVTEGIVIAGKTAETTSVLEICIPWVCVNGLNLQDNDKIGLSVQLINNDGGIGITAPKELDAASSANWAVATLSDYLVSDGMARPVEYANTIEIDGILNEAEWVIDKELKEKFYGDCDNEAAFGLLWDDNGIYAAFEVKDDVVVNSGAPYCWDDDSVELFLDIEAKGGAYSANDTVRTQLTFRYNDETVYIGGSPYNAEKHNIDCSLIRHDSAATDEGYTVEIYVPWAAFGRTDIGKGHVLGVTAQLNDKDVNDPAAYEESALAYTVSGGNNNSSATGWPTFILVADENASGELTDFAVINTTDSAVVSIPDNVWVEGSNTFTVSSENACVVAVSYDGGQTYIRLKAAATDAKDTYSFTVDGVSAETKIIVILKGDVNADGKVSVTDRLLLSRALLEENEAAYAALDTIGAVACDLNGDGVITVADRLALNRALLDEDNSAYAAPEWDE